MVADAEPVSVPRRGRILLVVLTLAGCGPGPLYYWGRYERLVYAMYAEPGNADPPEQIDLLREDVAVAQAKGGAVPPGVHAHLGYMYLLEGDGAAARRPTTSPPSRVRSPKRGTTSFRSPSSMPS